MSGSGGLFLKRGVDLAELIEQRYDAEADLQQLFAPTSSLSGPTLSPWGQLIRSTS
jgi:hypothetical protein